MRLLFGLCAATKGPWTRAFLSNSLERSASCCSHILEHMIDKVAPPGGLRMAVLWGLLMFAAPVSDRPVFYLCENGACRRPETEFTQLNL